MPPLWSWHSSVLPALVASLLVWNAARASLDCPAGQTDWYTEFIGETSCTTYQRLRQLCDPEYEVREWIAASPSPGDICDSFDGRCCCNYIAFSLGMLCLNCQVGEGDIPNGADVGINAPNGSYANYVSECESVWLDNKSLPDTVQTAVCNAQIQIRKPFYGGGWGNSDGWFYENFSKTLQLDFAETPSATFTNCTQSPSNASNDTIPTASSSLLMSSSLTTILYSSTTSSTTSILYSSTTSSTTSSARSAPWPSSSLPSSSISSMLKSTSTMTSSSTSSASSSSAVDAITKTQSKQRDLRIIGGSVGGFLLAMLILLSIIFYRRRRYRAIIPASAIPVAFDLMGDEPLEDPPLSSIRRRTSITPFTAIAPSSPVVLEKRPLPPVPPRMSIGESPSHAVARRSQMEPTSRPSSSTSLNRIPSMDGSQWTTHSSGSAADGSQQDSEPSPPQTPLPPPDSQRRLEKLMTLLGNPRYDG